MKVTPALASRTRTPTLKGHLLLPTLTYTIKENSFLSSSFIPIMPCRDTIFETSTTRSPDPITAGYALSTLNWDVHCSIPEGLIT